MFKVTALRQDNIEAGRHIPVEVTQKAAGLRSSDGLENLQKDDLRVGNQPCRLALTWRTCVAHPPSAAEY